jgi:hypothetical protein
MLLLLLPAQVLRLVPRSPPSIVKVAFWVVVFV